MQQTIMAGQAMPDNAGNPDGHSAMRLRAISSLVSSEMDAVNRCIKAELSSDVALINQMSAYIIGSGGKRLRPLVLLLGCGALGYRKRLIAGPDSYSEVESNVMLAAVIEFIHTATLLHDDVVDNSSMRRGQQTANCVWGNEASVLVGDFLYSRSFEMMVAVDSMAVMQIMAKTTNLIAEGEVMQLLHSHSIAVSEQQCLDTITRKTATLFASAAKLAAIISNSPAEVAVAMEQYGLRLGVAFQLMDDLLDYSAQTAQLGKNVGDDLAEGKITMPVIYAFNHASSAQRAIIKSAFEQAKRDKIDAVIEVISATGALQYTEKLAQEQVLLAKQALELLAPSQFKDGLVGLADFAGARTF